MWHKWTKLCHDHVYKTNWTAVLNEKLKCKKDSREEALSYNKHSVRDFKKDGTLVDNLPIELFRLIDNFMKKKNKENFVSALVLGPRKREVGLGVPATFTAVTKELTVAAILFAEILKTKTKYIHFKLSFAEYKKVKQPMLE